jgi:hypothetical protein
MLKLLLIVYNFLRSFFFKKGSQEVMLLAPPKTVYRTAAEKSEPEAVVEPTVPSYSVYETKTYLTTGEELKFVYHEPQPVSTPTYEPVRQEYRATVRQLNQNHSEKVRELRTKYNMSVTGLTQEYRDALAETQSVPSRTAPIIYVKQVPKEEALKKVRLNYKED